MIDQSYRNTQFKIFFVGTVFGVEVKLLKNVESGSNFSQAFIFDMYSNTLISRREYVRIVRHWIFYPNKMIGKDQREDLIRMSNFTFFEQQFKLLSERSKFWQLMFYSCANKKQLMKCVTNC